MLLIKKCCWWKKASRSTEIALQFFNKKSDWQRTQFTSGLSPQKIKYFLLSGLYVSLHAGTRLAPVCSKKFCRALPSRSQCWVSSHPLYWYSPWGMCGLKFGIEKMSPRPSLIKNDPHKAKSVKYDTILRVMNNPGVRTRCRWNKWRRVFFQMKSETKTISSSKNNSGEVAWKSLRYEIMEVEKVQSLEKISEITESKLDLY